MKMALMAVPASQSGGGKAKHVKCLRVPCLPHARLQETLQPAWGLPTLSKKQNCNRAGGRASGVAPHTPASGRSASAGIRGRHPWIPRGDAQRLEPLRGMATTGGRSPLPPPWVDTHHLGQFQQLRIANTQPSSPPFRACAQPSESFVEMDRSDSLSGASIDGAG